MSFELGNAVGISIWTLTFTFDKPTLNDFNAIFGGKVGCCWLGINAKGWGKVGRVDGNYTELAKHKA